MEVQRSTTFLPLSFCMQAAFPSPVKPQDICLLLSRWANHSLRAPFFAQDVGTIYPFSSLLPIQPTQSHLAIYLFIFPTQWLSSISVFQLLWLPTGFGVPVDRWCSWRAGGIWSLVLPSSDPSTPLEELQQAEAENSIGPELVTSSHGWMPSSLTDTLTWTRGSCEVWCAMCCSLPSLNRPALCW